jgi:hypothetical protein
MRKKLTILGALTALTVGVLGMFQTGTVSGVPVQNFSTTSLNWVTCYHAKTVGYPGYTVPPAHPGYPDPDGSGTLQSSVCGAGALADPLPTSTNVDSFTLITDAGGARLTLPTTFTPQIWGNVALACTVNGDNECGGADGVAGQSTGSTDDVVTGNVTARVDLGCGLGGVGVQDILASGGPGGAIGSWPDESLWNPVPFVRTSQNPAIWTGGAAGPNGDGSPTGGDNAYAIDIVPFPTTGINAATFSAIDTANITSLYIGGSAPLILPSPVLLQLVSYESGYASQPGLGMSVALLGGAPSNPPSDNTGGGLPPDIQCLDTPQNSVTANNTLVTPAGGLLAPRWNIVTSAQDLRDGVVDRILIWECRNTAGAPADADGDCLADGPDTADADTDADNDGVPDGIDEVICGGDPDCGHTVTGTADDGASDYDEIFQFTNPAEANSDGDTQLDRQDVRPTNTCADPTAPFTDCPLGTGNQDPLETADDNCPAVSNSSQANTDSNNDYHGKAGSTGDQSNATLTTVSVHFSNPSEDVEGDACDADRDNDSINDVAEAAITGYAPWSTANTSVCKGPGDVDATEAPAMALTSADGDSDNDLVLDGRECQFRSRPDIGNRTVATCPASIPVFPLTSPNGCAIPGNSLASPCAGQDPDSDQLCLSRSTGVHSNLERQFRTHGINTGPASQVNDTDGCGAAGDSDGDADQDTLGATCIDAPTAGFFVGLVDGDEVLFYNTSATMTDSDQDGCMDNEEVNDVNGTNRVDSGDQLVLSQALLLGLPVVNATTGVIANAKIVNFDLNKDGSISSGDQLAMARSLGTSANCAGHATNGASADLPWTFGAATKP